jgi:hypothetical protein
MANLGGGIADMLSAADKTADVYAGQPEKIKQKMGGNQGVTQDLINALALQKVTAEKDAAARDMQLQMQQNPATIVDQLQQKATGQATQEIAEQVGILGQQKQQKQQKAMQKLAGQMAKQRPSTNKPMQQKPSPSAQQAQRMSMRKPVQRPQGIASAMPQQQRPQQMPPQRPPQGMPPQMAQGMAQMPRPPMPQAMNTGGIVGFNKGKLAKGGSFRPEDITDKEVQAYREKNYTYDRITNTYKPIPKRQGVSTMGMGGYNPNASFFYPLKTTKEIKEHLAQQKTNQAKREVQQSLKNKPVFLETGEADPTAFDDAMLARFPAPAPVAPPAVDTNVSGNPNANVNTNVAPATNVVTPPVNVAQQAIDNVPTDKDALLAQNKSFGQLQDKLTSMEAPQSTLDQAGIETLYGDATTAVQTQAGKGKELADAARKTTMAGLGTLTDPKNTIASRYEANKQNLQDIYKTRNEDPRLKGSAFRAGLRNLTTNAYAIPGGGFSAGYEDAIKGGYSELERQQGKLRGYDTDFDTQVKDFTKEAGADARAALAANNITTSAIADIERSASDAVVTAAEKVADRNSAQLNREITGLTTLVEVEGDKIVAAANNTAAIAEMGLEQANNEADRLQKIKEKALELANDEVKNLVEAQGAMVIGLEENFSGNITETANYAQAVALAVDKNLSVLLATEEQLRNKIANAGKIKVDNPEDLK